MLKSCESPLSANEGKEETPWWRANVKNIANWKNYTQTLEEDKENPLNLYQVYHAINKVAKRMHFFPLMLEMLR